MTGGSDDLADVDLVVAQDRGVLLGPALRVRERRELDDLELPTKHPGDPDLEVVLRDLGEGALNEGDGVVVAGERNLLQTEDLASNMERLRRDTESVFRWSKS